MLDLRYANPKLAVRTIEKNRDVIKGIKVRLGRNLSGQNDMEALKLAREGSRLRAIAHHGAYPGHNFAVARHSVHAKKGDIVTHCYRGGDGGILDNKGRIMGPGRRASERGILFDVGHGVGSFSFDDAEKAMQQDFYPGTISSDLHQLNVAGPVFDLATTLSKFMLLGMSLEQLIERVQPTRPARLDFPQALGTLGEGAEADVAIFELREGRFDFVDSEQQKRTIETFPSCYRQVRPDIRRAHNRGSFP